MYTPNIAQIVVNPLFLDTYIAGLILLTALRLWSAEAHLRREKRDTRKILDCFGIDESLAARLQRIVTFSNEGVVSKVKGVRPNGIVRRSVRTFWSVIQEVPRDRHISEGLRPSENYFQSELARGLPRVSDFGDTIIRLSLIGTFAGLIAALTIASTNIGSDLTQGADATSQMEGFLEQLLSTAAVKFWISAVGLILALALRVWQGRIDRIGRDCARLIGPAFDRMLDGVTLPGWKSKMDGDAITQQIHQIAEEIRANADKWILTIQIGGAGHTQPVPQVELSRRS